jgi:hypothetical protein
VPTPPRHALDPRGTSDLVRAMKDFIYYCHEREEEEQEEDDEGITEGEEENPGGYTGHHCSKFWG